MRTCSERADPVQQRRGGIGAGFHESDGISVFKINGGRDAAAAHCELFSSVIREVECSGSFRAEGSRVAVVGRGSKGEFTIEELFTGIDVFVYGKKNPRLLSARKNLVSFAVLYDGLDETGKLDNEKTVVDHIERARRLEDLNTTGTLVDGLQLTATDKSGREGRVGVESRRKYVDHADLVLIEQSIGLTLHRELG